MRTGIIRTMIVWHDTCVGVCFCYTFYKANQLVLFRFEPCVVCLALFAANKDTQTKRFAHPRESWRNPDRNLTRCRGLLGRLKWWWRQKSRRTKKWAWRHKEGNESTWVSGFVTMEETIQHTLPPFFLPCPPTNTACGLVRIVSSVCLQRIGTQFLSFDIQRLARIPKAPKTPFAPIRWFTNDPSFHNPYHASPWLFLDGIHCCVVVGITSSRHGLCGTTSFYPNDHRVGSSYVLFCFHKTIIDLLLVVDPVVILVGKQGYQESSSLLFRSRYEGWCRGVEYCLVFGSHCLVQYCRPGVWCRWFGSGTMDWGWFYRFVYLGMG